MDSHEGEMVGFPGSGNVKDDDATYEQLQVFLKRLAVVQPLRARLLDELSDLVTLVRQAHTRDALTIGEEEAVARLIVDLRTLLDEDDERHRR
jgi:hypothetical protein